MKRSIQVPIGSGQHLQGDLEIPADALGVVAFAHGSGSSRRSPRNQLVAEELRQGRLATLLIDLLTEEEERVDLVTRELRFDIGLLADRMMSVVDWLASDEETSPLPIGLFGGSTGAAAALMVAARRPARVGAVVSRGGRPDLAEPVLRDIESPTLLIVGALDAQVIELNEQALAALESEKEIVIVPGATHLFEEPGKLEEVARLARAWFVQHLSAPVPETP